MNRGGNRKNGHGVVLRRPVRRVMLLPKLLRLSMLLLVLLLFKLPLLPLVLLRRRPLSVKLFVVQVILRLLPLLPKLVVLLLRLKQQE